MEFCTLAEIAQHKGRRREQLVGLVVSASPDLRAWRPAPEKWSIQEHLEHLALAARWFAGIFEELTARAQQEGLTASPDTPRQVDCVPLLVAAGLIGKKFQSPDYEIPRGCTPAESLAMLEREQARIEASVALLGLHETLHLGHMRANAEAWATRDQVQRA